MGSETEKEPAAPLVVPASEPPKVETGPARNDKFRHGRIVKFFSQGKYGFIRDEQGREVYFHLDEIRMLGEKRDRTFVFEGQAVGFDVGLSSRGLRVTHMKVY